MATTKITDLTAYTDPVNTDVLPIVDVTSDVTKKVSIANVMKNASLGTAAAPGIAFDGDPNTGIYSPGANQVAITTDGTQRMLIDSAGAVTIAGDLTVNGTTTNINTQNLVVEDKNIVLGDVTTPTDVTADGGGITLKGATDKTINWVDSTDAWTSSERFSYPTGSAAAPTLTFTGDTNTGIYSPGADQVAISTGGSGRLFVSANGVGVGAAEVAAYGGLQVRNSFIYVNEDGVNTKQLYIRTDTPGIQVASNDPFRILTNNQERLRITAAGLVGVGTSSPTYQLDCTQSIRAGNSGGNWDVLIGNRSANWSAGLSFQGSSTNTNWEIGQNRLASNALTFAPSTAGGGATFSTPLVTFTPTAVGIGTSSPGYLLEVRRNTTGDTAAFTASTDGLRSLIFSSSDNTGSGAVWTSRIDSAFGAHAWAINGTERLRITPTGVGIGTASPTQKLEIGGTGRSTLVVGSTNSFAELTLNGASTENYITSDDALAFYINTLERFRIDTSGRLLVGTSSSVGGNVQIVGSGNGSGVPFLHLRGTNAVGSGGRDVPIDFSVITDDTGPVYTTIARITAFKENGTQGNEAGALTFSTTADGASSPTERLRITSAGVLQVADAGNIAVGTTTGTKIGTATTQKLGFFNKTPVVQPAAVADATDAASVITQLNALLARMRDLGLIAT